MNHRVISSDVVPIFIWLPSFKGFWAFSASQSVSFVLVFKKTVFYFSMTDSMKLFAGHSAWSWSSVFFQGRIFTPVAFCDQVSEKAVSYFHACFVRWSSYLPSLGFGSDISVSRAGIGLKVGSSTAVSCSIPSYLQSQFCLHCVQRMLYTVKIVWMVECQFIE